MQNPTQLWLQLLVVSRLDDTSWPLRPAADMVTPLSRPPLASAADVLLVLDLETATDASGDLAHRQIVRWAWAAVDTRTADIVDVQAILVAPDWAAGATAAVTAGGSAHGGSYASGPPPEGGAGGGSGGDGGGGSAAIAPAPGLLGSGIPLAAAVRLFEARVAAVHTGRSVLCVTDGPWQLKQQLADEGWRKAVPLPPFFIRFFDLQTHFAGSYPAASPPPLCAADMAAVLGLPPPPRPPHPALARVTTMAAVVAALLRDGHPFLVPELACELDFSARPPAPGALLCDGIPAGCLLRLRGLPWAAREVDVARFLDGVDLLPGSRIRLVTDGGGRVTGEAFVQVVGPDAVTAAVSSHHRRLLGRRYVEVFRSSPWEMSVHLARAEAEGDRESSRSRAGGGGAGHSASGMPPLRGGGGGGAAATAAAAPQGTFWHGGWHPAVAALPLAVGSCATTRRLARLSVAAVAVGGGRGATAEAQGQWRRLQRVCHHRLRRRHLHRRCRHRRWMRSRARRLSPCCSRRRLEEALWQLLCRHARLPLRRPRAS